MAPIISRIAAAVASAYGWGRSFGEAGPSVEYLVVAGGAGSGVAEFIARSGVDCTVRHIGIPDTFIAHAGQGECRQLAGLTAEAIVAAAQSNRPIANQQTL